MMKFKFLLTILLLWSVCIPVFADGPADSVGVENQDGKKVILHKVEPKENFYSIARRYKVEPKAVIAFNNNAPTLTIGQVIKVPTDMPFAETQVKTNMLKRPVTDVNGRISPATQMPDDKQSSEATTQYKVGAGETLYGISKRFNTTVDAITRLNNLKSTTLTPGQLLLVTPAAQSAPAPAQAVTQQVAAAQQTVQQMTPKPVVQQPPVQQPPTPVAKRDTTLVAAMDSVEMSHRNVPGTRYGLSEKNEKGLAVWMDGDNLDPNKKWVLHRTAAIGTIIKIVNPMTNRTTYAKVVGRFTDNENTKDAIMVTTKNVAESLGAMDKRFHVTLSYAPTNE